MGLEAVVSDIQEKGRREAEGIRKETNEQVAEFLKEAQQRVGVVKLAAENDIQEQIARIMNQEDSAAHLIMKRQLLNAQKEILDQVYTVTLKSLADLPEHSHQEILTQLLLQASKEISAGVVLCNQRDVSFVKELIVRHKELAGYRVGNAVSIEGGVIVESKEGSMKIDLSYRTFLDKIWEVGLKEASDILFG